MKRKVVIGLLLAGQIFSAQAAALACIGTKSAGLSWENNQWKPNFFQLGRHERFIIRIDKNNNLGKDSLTKIFRISNENDINCSAFNESDPSFWNCSSYLGDTLFLSKDTLQGAVSSIFGGALPDSFTNKDSLTVTTFKCEKF